MHSADTDRCVSHFGLGGYRRPDCRVWRVDCCRYLVPDGLRATKTEYETDAGTDLPVPDRIHSGTAGMAWTWPVDHDRHGGNGIGFADCQHHCLRRGFPA